MEIDLREYLWFLELDFDIDAQLAAIRKLLKQNTEAQSALDDEDCEDRIKGTDANWRAERRGGRRVG
jgi:hypothetical protein